MMLYPLVLYGTCSACLTIDSEMGCFHHQLWRSFLAVFAPSLLSFILRTPRSSPSISFRTQQIVPSCISATTNMLEYPEVFLQSEPFPSIRRHILPIERLKLRTIRTRYELSEREQLLLPRVIVRVLLIAPATFKVQPFGRRATVESLEGAAIDLGVAVIIRSQRWIPRIAVVGLVKDNEREWEV